MSDPARIAAALKALRDADATAAAAGQTLASAEQAQERRRGRSRRAEDAPPKFTCPTCGGQLSRVANSRPGITSECVIRWRECLTCHWQYVTEEKRTAIVRPPMRKFT